MHETEFLIIAGLFLAFGLISRRIQGSVLTGPMLFAGLGLVLGPAVLGLVNIEITNSVLHTLAEITLVLVLFSDAASIDLRQLRRDHNLPLRMLLIGMPLTIAFGALVAVLLFPMFSIWEALLLAAILAPTDAALGQAVISNKAVPVRIRQALNVESGLNDGIALPVVLMFAALAAAAGAADDTTAWFAFGARQVTLGPLVGIGVGYLGARLVALSYAREWMAETAEGIISLAMAFGAYLLAELVGGNGFIAAFVGGLVFGNTLAMKCKFLYEFAEAEGQLLTLATFMAFGSAMLPLGLEGMGFMPVVYAVLALTVLRMLPVRLSLLGTGVSSVTSAFLGWFGPRGLASVLFVLLILEQADVPHKHEILVVSVLTVGLSILLHGLTAGPASVRYGARAKAMGECAENMPVAEEPFT